MTHSEAGKLGQAALHQKLGDGYNKHMARIDSLGFWQAMANIAERQQIPVQWAITPSATYCQI